MQNDVHVGANFGIVQILVRHEVHEKLRWEVGCMPSFPLLPVI